MLDGSSDRATPRPWEVDADGDISHGGMHIAHVTQADEQPRLRDDGTPAHALHAECEANGVLIIAAVNQFAELLAQRDSLVVALDLLVTMTRRVLDGASDTAAVRAALATAEAALLAHHAMESGER